jgi:hypothetical protein
MKKRNLIRTCILGCKARSPDMGNPIMPHFLRQQLALIQRLSLQILQRMILLQQLLVLRWLRQKLLCCSLISPRSKCFMSKALLVHHKPGAGMVAKTLGMVAP